MDYYNSDEVVVTMKWKHDEEEKWHCEDIYIDEVENFIKKLNEQGYKNTEIEAHIL